MYLMRKFEEKCGQLYIQQKFGGFCHLYIGQEAVLSGMNEALKPTDRVITAYRDHAHPLVLGTHPKFVAELCMESLRGFLRVKAALCTCLIRKKICLVVTEL